MRKIEFKIENERHGNWRGYLGCISLRWSWGSPRLRLFGVGKRAEVQLCFCMRLFRGSHFHKCSRVNVPGSSVTSLRPVHRELSAREDGTNRRKVDSAQVFAIKAPSCCFPESKTRRIWRPERGLNRIKEVLLFLVLDFQSELATSH